MRRVALLTAALMPLSACAASPTATALPRFEAALAAQDSATAALGQWCAAQGIADPPIITARPVGGTAAPPPNLRRLLGVSDAEPLGYRHVRLSCGQVVLSEAHNWYVPARLTPAMNTLLANSDTPFGKVAAPLHFRREPLETSRGRTAPCPHGTISTHRAVLRLPDGQTPGSTISLVVECYTTANLAGKMAR